MIQAEGTVHGSYDPAFKSVYEAFCENFETRNEVGASTSLVIEGKTVVDLWGGYADEAKTRPWHRNTVVALQSIIKGVAAICAHILVDRGLLDLDQPVANYWPEFGQAGKEKITVDELLSHQAGLAFPDHAREGDWVRWEMMLRALERQESEPGRIRRPAYHSSTYGFLVSELVKRISGKPIEVFFRDEIGKPLNVDFHIPYPKDREDDLADFLMNEGDSAFSLMQEDPLFIRAWKSFPLTDDFWNTTARETRIPHGFGNARGLARLFGALANGGELEGYRLMSPQTVETLIEPRWSGPCAMMGIMLGLCRGLFLNTANFVPLGPNPRSFCASGAGGSVGMGDPDARIGFGYAMNYMCAGNHLGPRAGALIDSVYQAAGIET
ncbi:MAG: serine hydrolase domain-containing protein [Acidobacteriota bacterium]|nr:serine hydrolase domain-containing protein [Acidobacteriota bacterium]